MRALLYTVQYSEHRSCLLGAMLARVSDLSACQFVLCSALVV